MIERLLLLATMASLALGQVESTSSLDTNLGLPSATPTDTSANASETASSTSSAGATFTVKVGLAGHTFQPDVVQAHIGDTIEFDFYPTNHSVIRAEYLFPCVPYELTGVSKQGFYSDFHPVDAILQSPPSYSIRINDSNPIFYYCGAPGSCIDWQMVGVINPNANTSLQKHKEAAKDSTFMLLPGENWPDEASASKASSSAGSAPTSTSSSNDQASNSTTTEDHDHGSSLSTGAIAGIAVGGTILVIAAAAILFFCGRASRRKNNAAAAGQQQPLMHQQMPFSPNPGHMSYVQPYPNDMNKHMSMQSAALPGYIPPHGGDQSGPNTPGQPMYGMSDALNPGTGTDYAGSPAQSPHMNAVGMQPAPAYSQRNSMMPQQPYSPGPQQTPHSPYGPGQQFPQQHSPYQAPQMTPNNFHEMPGAPVSDAQYQNNRQSQFVQHDQRPTGGSELSGSDTLGRGSPPPGAQQGGGIMNFIKQNTGGK